MALRWDHRLETGYREIDEEHKKLYRALSTLIEAVQDRMSKPAILEFLAFLLDYVERHFDTEESIMAGVSYPGIDQHRKAHKEFAEEVMHIAESYKKHGTSSLITIKLKTCAVAWLREHISTEDRQMAEFLKAVSKR